MDEMNISPRQKTAILLISLPPDIAGSIMRSFSPEEIRAISAEMSRARNAPPELRNKIVQEFLEKVSKLKKPGKGDTTSVKTDKTPEQVERVPAVEKKEEEKPIPITQNIQKLLGNRSQKPKVGHELESRLPFSFILETDPKKVAYVLKDESPQTIAAVLANLPPSVSSRILAFIPSNVQAEVTKRMSNIKRLSQEVLEVLRDAVKEELDNLILMVPAVKEGRSSEMLSHVDKVTEKRILDGLTSTISRPSMMLSSRGRSLQFDDIAILEPNAIKELIRITDTRDLLIALKGASQEIVNKVLSVLPPAKARAIMEDLKALKGVSEEEIRRAQQQIRSNLRGLITIGKIKLPGT